MHLHRIRAAARAAMALLAACLLLPACLLLADKAAAQAPQPYGTYQNYSAVVGTTATTIWQAATWPPYVRVVAIDTAILGGASSTAAIWCAWGTSGANAAVIGTNGFPLNAGFDDAGYGVAQSALNCIQAGGNSHYVRFETR